MKNHFDRKTVLITGHTGFKGAWLTAWLKDMGANVVGIALDTPTEPSHFNAAQLAEGMVNLRLVEHFCFCGLHAYGSFYTQRQRDFYIFAWYV